jgi:YidC/Oxa1 family membrane protein insertase
MNLFFEIYNLIFYQPVYQILFFLYKSFNDFGLAIIFLTFLIRLILFPLNYRNSKEEEKLLKIKNKFEEIAKKSNGKMKQDEILALYRKEKINPVFNLIFLFVQFLVLVTLYKVFLKGMNQLDPSFFKILDLSRPNFLLVLGVVLFQLIYFKFIQPKKEKNPSLISQSQGIIISLPLTFLILLNLPSAISLYLLTNYLFLIFQKAIFHV